MRNLITYSFFLINYAILSAQPDSTYLPFVAEWAPGSSHYFMITDTENLWEQDTLTKSDTLIKMANLQVLESNAKGFMVRWRENFSPEELGVEVDPDAEFIESEIIYQMDSLGRFLTVQNWQELSEKAIEEMYKALQIESLTKEDSAVAMMSVQPILAQLRTEQGVSSLLTEEIQLIHFPFGRAFSTAKTEYFETTLPFIGGDPVEALGELYIDTINPERSRCLLIQEITVNSDQTSNHLHEFFKKMGASEEEIQSEIGQATLDISKTLIYNYEIQLSLPNKITYANDSNSEVGHLIQNKEKRKVIRRISVSAQASR